MYNDFMMKKSLLLLLIITFSVSLSGCLAGSTDQKPVTNSPVQQKQGDTIKTGKISGSPGQFFIQETGKTPEPIDSYSIDLNTYVGQTVTIVGQYSGDTLFVGEVK